MFPLLLSPSVLVSSRSMTLPIEDAWCLTKTLSAIYFEPEIGHGVILAARYRFSDNRRACILSRSLLFFNLAVVRGRAGSDKSDDSGSDSEEVGDGERKD